MVVQLNSCCCGCSLRTGTLILGWLGVICSLLGIAGFSVVAAGIGPLITEAVRETKKSEGASQAQIDEALKELDESNIVKILTAVYAVLAVIMVIDFIMCVLLLVGTYQERPRLLRPWIIFAIVCLSVQVLFGVIGAIMRFVEGQAGAGVIGLISLGLGVALGSYFILVVNSFYRQLTNERPAIKM